MRSFLLSILIVLSAAAVEEAPLFANSVAWKQGLASPEKTEGREIHWYRTVDMALALTVEFPKDGGKAAVRLSEFDRQIFASDDIAAPEAKGNERIVVRAVDPSPSLISTSPRDRYVVVYDRQRRVLFLLAFQKKDGRFDDDVSESAIAEMALYLNGVDHAPAAATPEPVPTKR